MRTIYAVTVLLAFAGCNSSKSESLMTQAKEAKTCDDLVKVYEANEKEAQELVAKLKAGEIKGESLGLSCPPTPMDKDSCGCPLSAGDCTGFFFGCFGGDATACCWFDACDDRSNKSKCDSYCDECSSWGPSPVGGSGVGGEEE